MTAPDAPRTGDDGKVVEIDAIDVAEWERDQHTPRAPVAGLAALVRQTVPTTEVESLSKRAASASQAAEPLPSRGASTERARPPQPSSGQAPAAGARQPAPAGVAESLAEQASTATSQQARPAVAASPQADSPATATTAAPPVTPSAPAKLTARSLTIRPAVTSSARAEPAAVAARAHAVPTLAASSQAVPTWRQGVAAPRLPPEVVRLPLAAPPSEPIVTPTVVIPRPLVVESERRLRSAPDHTPAPPALDSFDSPALAGSPERGLRPRLASRRALAIGGAAAAVVVAVIVVAMATGTEPQGPATSPSSTDSPASPPAVVAAHEPPPVSTIATSAAVPATSAAVPAASAAVPAASAPPSAVGGDPGTASPTDTAPSGPAEPPEHIRSEHSASLTAPLTALTPITPQRPHRLRSTPLFRGHKVSRAPVKAAVRDEPDPGEEEPAIARARVAYDAGNRALFAGDSAAAIRAYRQVLAYAPTYAAGFRGLGLAHAQRGDIGAAIMALRTYLSLAPHARDVALIKKRIAILQAGSAEGSASRPDP